MSRRIISQTSWGESLRWRVQVACGVWDAGGV
jgi:hypothetical protein